MVSELETQIRELDCPDKKISEIAGDISNQTGATSTTVEIYLTAKRQGSSTSRAYRESLLGMTLHQYDDLLAQKKGYPTRKAMRKANEILSPIERRNQKAEKEHRLLLQRAKILAGRMGLSLEAVLQNYSDGGNISLRKPKKIEFEHQKPREDNLAQKYKGECEEQGITPTKTGHVEYCTFQRGFENHAEHSRYIESRLSESESPNEWRERIWRKKFHRNGFLQTNALRRRLNPSKIPIPENNLPLEKRAGALVRIAMRALNQRERIIIKNYFIQDRTLEEIGKNGLNLTRERVRQIKEEALTKMRDYLQPYLE